jgi:hypothetical protein
MTNYEPTIEITYTSILKEEYRNNEFIASLVEKASIANKEMSIGGQIEIQIPYKFIKQTIYGKESVTMSLYRRIQNDGRHTITNEHIQVIDTEIIGDWGMTWVNRELGKHYYIVDTMELQTLPSSPNKRSQTQRRTVYNSI